MAAEGLRVLGVARAVHDGDELPDSPRQFAFDFVGLAGLSDPLRASAAAAVRECRSAGIRVIMITGDYPETAASIARQAGLDADHVMTGEALEIIDEAELGREIGRANVFARIMPEQKLRIVNALKANGEVVALVARDAGLHLLNALYDHGPCEVLVAIFDRLELAPVDRNDSPREKVN